MDYRIKEDNWKEILKKLQIKKRIHTKKEDKLRKFIEAVWYIVRSGCQWRLLPSYYGSWRAIHKRFKEWSDKGIWLSLFDSIKNYPDKELYMIDATIVRSHACSAGYKKNSQEEEALGRSKGGFSTKISALVDGLGNPIKITLTGGQDHDITQAEILCKDLSNTTLTADKGYDSDKFVKFLEEKNCISVIPPRKNRKNPRKFDKHIYKERHLVECFFGKIKHYRRIFSRFDKIANVYLSFLYFVCVFIWLR